MIPTRDDDPATSSVRFAAVLHARRVMAGMTQLELAARAGVGVRTVRELERARVNRPQRSTLELLANALGLTGSARDAFAYPARRVSRRSRSNVGHGLVDSTGYSGSDGVADDSEAVDQVSELPLGQQNGEQLADEVEISG